MGPRGHVQRDDLSDSDDDLEDDEEESKVQRKDFSKRMDFTFMGSKEEQVKQKEIAKKIKSIQDIRKFLEDSLGQDTLYKAYPILRDFGEKILFEEYFEDLVEQLDGILERDQVRKYHNYFLLMVFHDLEVDKHGGGEEGMF